MTEPSPSPYTMTMGQVGVLMLGLVGVFLAIGYSVMAVKLGSPGLFAGVPVVVGGILCLGRAHRQWTRTEGQRGGAWATLGSVLIIGSVWAAFMTNSAMG